MRVFHRIAEGGQVWAHRVRMFRQVVRIALLISLLASVSVLAFQLSRTDRIVYWTFWYRAKAHVMELFHGSVPVDPEIWGQLVRNQSVRAIGPLAPAKVLNATERLASQHWREFRNHVLLAGSVFVISCSGTLLFFLIRGGLSSRKEIVEGQRIVSARKLAIQLHLSRSASSLRIGGLPLVRGSETQHTLILGGTGSGKTNCLHHLLPQIRKRGERVVILDTGGALCKRYYRERDLLLQPGHPDSLPWHPWAECIDRFDRDSLAESLIPISYHDLENYWRGAARTLLGSLLEKLSVEKQTSGLTRWLFYESLKELCCFVQGTRAASVLDFSSEKTAASVRSVAASFLESLDHLKDTDDPFSIRKWVLEGERDSWLFLCCTPPQRSSFRPLLGSWISIVIRSLLHQEPDLNRRLWLVIDELPSMHKIKDLELFLTEGRKYGGCGLLSIQSPAQLEAIYGRDVTQIILGNCATKIVFSERDPEVAQRISKMFGQQEVREFQEGISYGAHQMRDGVNLSNVSRQRPIVSATAIQSLNQNQAYVNLPGNRAIARVKLPIVGERS